MKSRKTKDRVATFQTIWNSLTFLWLFQTKIKLYHESETIYGGLGACSTRKFSKLRCSTQLKMNFRNKIPCLFPDFWNSVANSLAFKSLFQIPWLFQVFQVSGNPEKKMEYLTSGKTALIHQTREILTSKPTFILGVKEKLLKKRGTQMPPKHIWCLALIELEINNVVFPIFGKFLRHPVFITNKTNTQTKFLT